MSFLNTIWEILINFNYISVIEAATPIAGIILAIVVLAGIFSSIETALFVISDAKIMRLKKQGRKQAEILLKMKKNMTRTISSIIFISNAINILGATIVTTVTINTIGASYTALVSILLTFIVIIFSKIIPKIIGQRFHVEIALRTAYLVFFISKITAPLSFLIEKISNIFLRNSQEDFISEEDIRMQMKIAAKTGKMAEEKITHIESIFNLTNKNVFDVMTPSTQLEYVNDKDSVYDEKIIRFFQRSAHTRIVVVGKDINHIKGYVLKNHYLNQLINHPDGKENEEKNILARLTKPILTVLDSISVNELLKKLQEEKQMIAIVKNKFGTTLGVVTMEDIIEQIIGEIIDETDKHGSLREVGKQKFKDYLKEEKDKKV